MKRNILNHKKQLAKQIGAVLLSILLIAGSGAGCIYANAAGSSGSEIYHHHTGNGSMEGGCYGEPVYHTHSGNEKEGGICYQTPVFHAHQGDEGSGGGCYGNVIYHTHEGDPSAGGACYSGVKHAHTAACNSSRECKVTYETSGVFNTWYDTCYHHQETVYGEANAIAYHSSCGMGKVETTTWYCLACGPYAISHNYTVTTCGFSTSSITGYKLSCGKDESTPERYGLDCEKDGTVIDAYALSCEKTDSSVDGYRLNCGLEEGVPVARLNLTNETAGVQQTVNLSASVTDLTGGKRDIGSGTYCWYDESGNVIGQQPSVTVSQNGTYRLEFIPNDSSLGLSGLSCSIGVDNVLIPTPLPIQTPTGNDSGDKHGTVAEEGGNPGNAAEEGNRKETAISSATASPSPVPSATPTATSPHISEVFSGGIKEGVSAMIGRLWEESGEEDAGMQTPMPAVTPSPTHVPTEPINGNEEMNGSTETEQQPEVLGEERKDENTWMYEFKVFMKKPAVKIFTLTTGTLISAGLLGIMLFFLRRTVKVYNDDGNGNMIYLGRCIIADEGDNFSITITREMVEKSCTNRYCIRPGLFRLGRREGQELFVCKDRKRVSVYLDKEMIVVI